MKIAIAGGSGFIGTHLVAYLMKKQHEVILVTRKPQNNSSKMVYVTWDELERNGQRIEKLDAWINLAGETISQRWTKAAKARIMDSREQIIHRMAKLIDKLQDKPKVIINSSAIGIYGISETETFTESSKTEVTDFLSSVVEHWEKATEQFRGIRVVKLRTGLVLGMDGGPLPSMVMPYRFGAGGTVGKGSQWVSWIHIDDAVRIIEYCMSKEDLKGAVNATSPNPATMEQFGKTIAKVWRRPNLIPMPGFMMKLMFGEMSILVLEGQRVLPQVLMEHDFEFQYIKLEAALSQLHAKIK